MGREVGVEEGEREFVAGAIGFGEVGADRGGEVAGEAMGDEPGRALAVREDRDFADEGVIRHNEE